MVTDSEVENQRVGCGLIPVNQRKPVAELRGRVSFRQAFLHRQQLFQYAAQLS